jgi:large subunit ribosomal protein L29
MARVKIKVLREMNKQELQDKLSELRADLAKLRTEASKGTLKKETGSIRWIRRDIARILTILRDEST